MLLICLPYAGGSENIFYDWKKYLNKKVKLKAVPLKGRGTLFYEELYKDINEAVEDIYNNIKEDITIEEYVIYGHSMGSILAYELYYKIEKENKKLPKYVIFSGHSAPHKREKERKIHLLSDEEFIKEIEKLGGTEKEIFENNELVELVVPILRNDFKMLSEYKFIKPEKKIKCNIAIFNGVNDDIKKEQLLAWNELSEKNGVIYNFEGDHFFINTEVPKIVERINEIILKEM